MSKTRKVNATATENVAMQMEIAGKLLKNQFGTDPRHQAFVIGRGNNLSLTPSRGYNKGTYTDGAFREVTEMFLSVTPTKAMVYSDGNVVLMENDGKVMVFTKELWDCKPLWKKVQIA